MTKSKEALTELRKKYEDAQLIQIIFASTALWALHANARQHQFVEQTIAKYIDEHAGTPAAKALVATRPKSKRP
jgi:hypothetical protein